MAESDKLWGTPDEVFQVTETMQRVEAVRAKDRAKVDRLANGDRPYTHAEEEEFGHQLNVNWLEMARKLQDATGQINNAFIPGGNFFSVHSIGGNAAKREEYGQTVTKEIHVPLKTGGSGDRCHYVLRSRNASVSSHGIGPLMWTSQRRLLPRFMPLEDLLIPTDTLLSFSTNLEYFAVNLYLTPGELFRMACTGKTDPAWNKQAVKNILKDLKNKEGRLVFNVNASDWEDRPEAAQELEKQNRGYLDSDAVPRVRLRAFYYLCDDGTWRRKIILRDNTPTQPSRGDDAKFIYDGKTAFAENIRQILHCQFGDNSLVAPLRYHSVRGIGTMLYAPALTLNRLRSQAVQHIFENLQRWLRIQDPNDRDRAKQMLMMKNAVVPEGVTFVKNDERHQIDPRLLEFGLAQMKQNMAENSSSYTADTDTGTNKEQTAFEVGVKLQSANAMVGNVLGMMYRQEIFLYEEFMRRALIKNTDDPSAKKFQEACKKAGIPDELMVPENWHIIAERALGSGDDAIARSQVQELMANRQSYEPEAQRKILRLFTGTLLKDHQRAEDLVLDEPDQSSSGTRAAENVYGTLMRGIVVPMRKGIDHVGYCTALLAMLQVEVQRIGQTDGMGTPADLAGFTMVLKSVGENLEWLSQDDKQKEIVRQLGDQVGQIANLLKAMAQRQQEAMEAAQQPQPDPESLAKVQATQMLAQVKVETTQQMAELKAQIAQIKNDQALQQNQISFAAKQQQAQEAHELRMRQQAEKLEADLTEQGARTAADLKEQGMRTSADLQSAGMEIASEIKSTEMKTAAEIESMKSKAAAQKKSAPPKE